MLTVVEKFPEAKAVEIPPLDHRAPLLAAIRAGHGKYVFSSDNEILFFGDKEMPDG
jgi:hypothetical protein